MSLKSLDDLFLEELKDIFDAEKRLTKALPKMAKAATSDVLRAYDRWMVAMRPTDAPEAERLRDGNSRAIEADPALGGWRMLSARGPDGLVANAASRQHFFGEDLE